MKITKGLRTITVIMVGTVTVAMAMRTVFTVYTKDHCREDVRSFVGKVVTTPTIAVSYSSQDRAIRWYTVY